MHRRNFVANTGLTIAGLALANHQVFARFFQDPAFKMKALNNGVGVFTEKGGTIAYLVNKEGVVVVDAQFPPQAMHLIDALKKQTDSPFKWLINTHHHGDHTAGNIAFKDVVQHVAAHANSKINQQNAAVKQKKEDQQLYPDTTFTDTWQQAHGNEKIKGYYYGAGHTNGDAIIHFQHANVAHLGDLLFNRRHPFIDRTAGAKIASWIGVLNKTINTFDSKTTFVCGHAFDPEKIVTDKEDINVFKAYLESLLYFAQSEFKAGKTKEEFIKNKAFPGSELFMGDGIERPLTAAFEEVSS